MQYQLRTHLAIRKFAWLDLAKRSLASARFLAKRLAVSQEPGRESAVGASCVGDWGGTWVSDGEWDEGEAPNSDDDEAVLCSSTSVSPGCDEIYAGNFKKL